MCRWLYQWYQIDTLETRLFVLRFIPQLLWVYLYNVANNEAPAGQYIPIKFILKENHYYQKFHFPFIFLLK